MTIVKLMKTSVLAIFSCLLGLVAAAQPTANFSAVPTSGCAPLVVSFIDQSTGNPTSWRWDLGNGTTSILQNPSVTYFNPGQYTVRLIVQNAAGRDTLIRTQYITIYAQPTINFTSSTTAGCYPLTVNFTDQSTAGSGTIASWQWDFGDGTLSNQQNPSHVYTSSGSFNVSLRITNSNGCTKTVTRTNYINIMEKPRAGFNVPNATACRPPANIQFQNTTVGTPPLIYIWNFGDGGTSNQPNPSHVYTTSGTFSVQLIVVNQNGCRDTIIRNNIVSIGTTNTSFTAPDSICVNASATITNTSTPPPTSVSWDFGDGTNSTLLNPTKTYSVPGTYQIKLVNQFNGCSDSTIRTIVVKPAPQAAFTGTNTSACKAPLTVNFSNSSTNGITYLWNFGDGTTSTQVNPVHTYTSTGNFTVTLTATGLNGCSSTQTMTDFVQIVPPVATINQMPQRGCAPLPWTFDASVVTTDPVSTYLWDFGDGTTSTLSNPSHVFNTGIYDISLIVTTASGCRDTVTYVQGVRAGDRPHAAFSATPLNTCAFLPVVFSDSSTGNVTDWFWDFGDGGTAIIQNPEHTYTDTGYFTVMLIVMNNGCPDTLIKEDYVHINPPIANFRSSFSCDSPRVRTFTDLSIGADTWNWDFGDGTTSTQQNPVHTYAAAGTYNIVLTVFNTLTGCSHDKDITINIYDEVADFIGTPTTICKKDTVHFSTVGINPANISTYAWTFGNGATATTPTANIVYNNAGSFNVRLIITDLAGCKDTLLRTQYIRVNGPVANFTSTVAGTCFNSLVNFTDNSTTDGVNPIVRWIWNWGDGRIDTLNAGPFQHVYVNPGLYTVKLTVTDSSGCSDSRTRTGLITISRPQANFRTVDTTTCPNRTVAFTNTSTGPGLTYLWHFGDGNTSTAIAPTHSYLANGSYTVKLVVVDQYGCSDSLTRSNYVSVQSPFASFTVSDSVSTCPPLVVDFTNQSQNYTSLLWDFGDGTTSINPNPSHFYSISGVYIARLTVTGPGGCTDIKEIPIIVRGPYGTFTYADLNGCSPLQVHFTATTRDRTSFIWDFNDGNTLSTTDSIVNHTYTIPGAYLPKMILRDQGGCVVPVIGDDSIYVYGVTADMDFSTQPICDAGTVQLNSTSVSNDGITQYQWTFGDGGTSTQANPSHHYAQTGLFYPTLVVTTQHSCRDSLRSPVPVKVVASPQGAITQTANGCVPVTVQFNGSLVVADTSAMTWVWSFGNGSAGTGIQPAPVVYNQDGNYPVTLVLTNSSGCSDTVTSSVSAYPIPVVSAGPDTLICQGTGRMLHATGADTYQWTPSTGLSCSNCANPVATPASQTQYIVTGTTIHGCSNTDSVIVSVVLPFQMNSFGGDTLCVGKSTRMAASGAHHYQWTPATGLDNPTSATPVASPQQTTNYMVVGFDDKGCFTDTAVIRVVVYPIPTIEAGDDKTINAGQTIDLVPVISPDVTNVTWSPTGSIFRSDFPGVTVKPRETTTYQVIATNPGKCVASDRVTVHVICNGSNIFIPNTFSPNSDGSNDIFYPRGTGVFMVKSMRIFNRWGEMVFEKSNFNANDMNAGWDGSFRGAKLNPDVYVYVIDVKCDNDVTLNYKGNVTLIR